MIVLHDLMLAAQWAGRIVVLDKGRLHIAGTPVEAITPQMLADVYGIAARVEYCSKGRLQIMTDGLIRPHDPGCQASPTSGKTREGNLAR